MRIKQENHVWVHVEEAKFIWGLWKAVRAALNRKSSIERFGFNELYQTLAKKKRRKRELALKQKLNDKKKESSKHVELIQAKSKLMSAKNKTALKSSRS